MTTIKSILPKLKYSQIVKGRSQAFLPKYMYTMYFNRMHQEQVFGDALPNYAHFLVAIISLLVIS